MSCAADRSRTIEDGRMFRSACSCPCAAFLVPSNSQDWCGTTKYNMITYARPAHAVYSGVSSSPWHPSSLSSHHPQRGPRTSVSCPSPVPHDDQEYLVQLLPHWDKADTSIVCHRKFPFCVGQAMSPSQYGDEGCPVSKASVGKTGHNSPRWREAMAYMQPAYGKAKWKWSWF